MISVLFVDDEPALLEITRLYLEKSGSMTVETCRSALEALGILKNRKFDVIVSDYEMPLMDGIMFLKILRAEKNDTPFLIFTGKGREHVVIEALNNGADFYLQKGGDPKTQFTELTHMIEQAVQRRDAEENLKASEKLLVEIINFLPDATFAIDNEGRVISWNKAMEDLSGVKSEAMMGKGDFEYAIPFYGTRRPILIDLIIDSDEEIRKRYYSIIKREGDVLIAETEKARPRGKPSVLWSKATPLYNPKGERIGAIESIRDITEFRRAKNASAEVREEAPAPAQQPAVIDKNAPGIFDRMFGKTSGAWYKKGVDLYYKQGKFQDAIHCFDRVIETEPDHAGAWNGRGICLKELGRYEEAIQCFDRVITLSPNDEEVYYNKGEALEKLGKALGDIKLFEEAIKAFDIVINMNPHQVYAWNYRGVCLKELGRYEDAKKCFDHAQLLIRRGQAKTNR
ncbi:MAG TPA: tetratricopeptide repeat protein [Methanoregulaceae archaeon]|nr:tetratricopeptide repeat protein [Methanoregulaceae archaeon]